MIVFSFNLTKYLNKYSYLQIEYQVVNSSEDGVSNFGKMTVSPMLNIGRVWLG